MNPESNVRELLDYALHIGVRPEHLFQRVVDAIQEWEGDLRSARFKRDLRRIQRACSHEWVESMHLDWRIRECSKCLNSQFQGKDGTFSDRHSDTFIGNAATSALIAGVLPDGRRL